MKTIYLDLFSGISGDMFVGAMLDLGVDFGQLERALGQLSLEHFQLQHSRQQRAHISGTKFDVLLEDAPVAPESGREPGHAHAPVHGRAKSVTAPAPAHVHAHGHGQGTHEHDHAHDEDDHGHPGHAHHDPHRHGDAEAHDHAHAHEHAHDEHGHGSAHDHAHEQEHEHEHEHEHGRTFAQIRELIRRSSLSDWVKQKSVAVFQRIAVAEGKVHGLSPEQVHFHEVGAVDSIVDIVGACVALETLGCPRVLASPVVEGTGWIYCAHGSFPLPAPATLEILAARSVAISQCDEPQELVTPTGAALLAEFVETFGPLRELKAQRVGYGLGTRENKTRPNVLRAILGEAGSATAAHDWETDTVTVLQTNLDDVTAEVLGGVVEKALAQGALDAFHTPVQMKKNRPGVLLTVLCPPAEADRFAELLLRETTAFGVRRQDADRRKLRREVVSVRTPYGEVTLKLGRLDGRIVHAAPEYESCRRLAEQARVPLKQIYEAAVRAAPPAGAGESA